MPEKNFDNNKQEQKNQNEPVDLENQFILRLPEEPAAILREAIQSNNLRDRMSLRLDNDLRYGEVRLDNWLLHAKIVDLPTIIECLKTIDSKNFYKSADICQMMICKEDPEALDVEKVSPNKCKKKDPTKVDKKYLWPHGLTPPCKNVRKRRFRKTLKKKNVEAPEIEKEVKRLLRVDNEAVKVEFEIISEDAEKPLQDQQMKDEGEEEFNNEIMNEGDKSDSSRKDINVESDGGDEDGPSSVAPISVIDEQDIFGEELSSSDEELEDRQNQRQMHDMGETSRLTADDSRSSESSMSVDVTSRADDSRSQMNTKNSMSEFDKSMFGSPKPDVDDMRSKFSESSSNLDTSFFETNKSTMQFQDESANDVPQLSAAQIHGKLIELHVECDDLKQQRAQKASEIDSIQNPTLKMRMEEAMENLRVQIEEKEKEIKSYQQMLSSQ